MSKPEEPRVYQIVKVPRVNPDPDAIEYLLRFESREVALHYCLKLQDRDWVTASVVTPGWYYDVIDVTDEADELEEEKP